MALQPLLERVQQLSPGTRSLRLIWKDPATGRHYQVGHFTQLEDGRYRFYYEDDLPSSFTPLAQFPETDQVYESEDLPAFFANRVMTRSRSSYPLFVSWLGLNNDSLPIELLSRTGGGRVTDTFHLVDSFNLADGACSGRFFVSGIQHSPDSTQILARLHEGQELHIVDEPDNPQNPGAMLLTIDGEKLGWIPDWLVDDVHALREESSTRIFVEQINLDAPARLQVLCRLDATTCRQS